MATILLRLPEVQSRTGLSRSSIYQKINEGNFPAAISLGKRAVAWVDAEVDAWINSRIDAARGGSRNV